MPIYLVGAGYKQESIHFTYHVNQCHGKSVNSVLASCPQKHVILLQAMVPLQNRVSHAVCSVFLFSICHYFSSSNFSMTLLKKN